VATRRVVDVVQDAEVEGQEVTDSADHVWTGYNEWVKQAARGKPPLVARSLNNGIDITDSAILLASNYVTVYDVRKTTDVAREAPDSASWGGNAGVYIQHKASGKAGQYGTLTAGIRAQLETTQEHGAGPVNDACAAYFGLYNNGKDVGGFGLHVDAYHAGSTVNGHSTYGMSAECWKERTGGVMASYVARSQKGVVDFGVVLTHSGDGAFKTGIALGSPSYAQGGVQGAPGTPTKFDVGIDLSMAECKTALRLAVPCDVRFDPTTGMFSVQNVGFHTFDVNMSNGIIWQNGNATWAAFSPVVRWAFSVGPGKTATAWSNAQPVKMLRVEVDGEEFLMALYRP
jgi:hypothetical protein